jgi:hypothetical protein
MKEIPLSQGYFVLCDDDDYKYLNQWKWHICPSKNGNIYYAIRGIKRDGKHTTISMQVQLLGLKEGFEIHHKNCNGLDCQHNNMEFVTTRVNQQYRQQVKTSKYPGVCWKKDRGYWIAYIKYTRNGFQSYLGRFSTEEAAYEAYQMACQSEGLEVR